MDNERAGCWLLPPELVIQVIEAVAPANQDALLLPSHSSTKTLLAFTRVSRATCGPATRLLGHHCAYVDSSGRLASLLLCVAHSSSSPLSVTSKLFLGTITSLYLSPFGQCLDDQPTAAWTRELLCTVAPTLRRLVVQMPFASLDPLDDHLSVRRSLWEGFEKLVHLHEFVCLGEYPSLTDSAGRDIWRAFPRLRRLALFHGRLDSQELWEGLASLDELENVVLARPRSVGWANVKGEYFHQLASEVPGFATHGRLLFVEAAYELCSISTEGWEDLDPRNVMMIESYEVPLPFYGDETPEELVTQWVKGRAVGGTLWQQRGDRIG